MQKFGFDKMVTKTVFVWSKHSKNNNNIVKYYYNFK